MNNDLKDAKDTRDAATPRTGGRCRVMGIVNVTPDSFSDGGKYFRPEEAVRRARNMVADGAAIIDLGGESTRPGATPLGWEEEWARLEPIMFELRRLRVFELHTQSPSGRPLPCQSAGYPNSNTLNSPTQTRLSVDTYHVETAERALAAGARILNCVYPEPVPAMCRLAAATPDAEVVVPAAAWDAATAILPVERLYIDPMIGFGTTREEDVALLRSLPDLARKGRVLVGASRKRIVKKLTGERVTGKNLGGSLGVALWCALHGAAVVRVHDVRETAQALKVFDLLGCDPSSPAPSTQTR